MSRILLAYLAEPKYGGWPTFTAHLAKGLRAAGMKPLIVNEGRTSESKTRDFGRGEKYQNLSPQDLLVAAKEHPVIITAVDKKHHQLAAALISAGVPVVIHDPTELKTPIKELVQQAKVVVIRETMLAHLPKAQYIRHPYARHGQQQHGLRAPAASISRVDFDKHTELIVSANQQLKTPIDIYGFCNSVYAHFKLKEVDSEWERNYRGRFDADDLWAAKRIAEGYNRIVDMSVIKKDGGGTQYTFLEAADAGSALILNEGWQARGRLAEYAHSVATAEELAAACGNPLDARSEEGRLLLDEHDAKTIAQEYRKMLGV